MAKLYSYVVARDFGFAPNPYHGVCTLATCMPKIRNAAREGDWIIGTGTASKRYKKRFQSDIGEHLVYFMRVDKILTFDEYWRAEEFAAKKPILNGSYKYQMGDNIYHWEGDAEDGRWRQANSHHSRKDGTENCNNLEKDTGANKVLIGHCFGYWGRGAIEIPAGFRDFGEDKHDVVNPGRGYKCKFPKELVDEFAAWLEFECESYVQGEPAKFK